MKYFRIKIENRMFMIVFNPEKHVDMEEAIYACTGYDTDAVNWKIIRR